MDRREFLKFTAAGLGTSALPAGAALPRAWGAPSTPAPGGPAPGGIFTCGVVSGLDSDTSVVLWTRVQRPPGVAGPVPVAWAVSPTPGFDRVVASGTAGAVAGSDLTVKVRAGGLRPHRAYYYRFHALGAFSPIGRARTLPRPGARPERFRFAFGSCQHFAAGYFTAYQGIANEDVDCFVHLGDYIYESGGQDVRLDTVGEARTLAQYRAKYRLYRSDLHMQAAHANHPLVPIWDDHEFRNNFDRFTIAEDMDRWRAALQAWVEYMPVFPESLDADRARIHRSHRWGALAELILLDTRQYRDPELPILFNTAALPGIMATWPGHRTILGADQKAWLLERLERSPATWQVIGNQVVFLPWRLLDFDTPEMRSLNPEAQRNAGIYMNGDQWDAYLWERRQILEHLQSLNAAGRRRNVAVLTGDVHSFWAGSVRPDYDDDTQDPVAVEFVGGGVTSGYAAILGDVRGDLGRLWLQLNPHFVFVDLIRRGYAVAEITASDGAAPSRLRVEFKVVDHRAMESWPVVSARFRVDAGSPALHTETP